MFTTNDMKIEFSSQIDATTGKPYVYNIVSGSTIEETFNETLDNASIILSHIDLNHRLTKIQPYQWVRIYDTSTTYNSSTHRYAYDRFFLIDNFYEKEDNIDKHLFTYTIKLFSETKILEKIQCPNRMISHRVNNDGSINKKTIFNYICEYMELYCPKIKKVNESQQSTDYWDYEYLIEWDTTENNTNPLYARFNVECADINNSSPTLRQLLTTIMMQVGCIPLIKDRKLLFVDLSAEASNFALNNDYTINNTVNSIQRSLSSDSYANSLISMQNNIYSQNTAVFSESLSFRDTNSLLIKQTENLKLETRFPIYKVQSFVMKVPATTVFNYYGNSAAYNNYGAVDLLPENTQYYSPEYSQYPYPILYKGNILFGTDKFKDINGNQIGVSSLNATEKDIIVRLNLSIKYGIDWKITNFKIHIVRFDEYLNKYITDDIVSSNDSEILFYKNATTDPRFYLEPNLEEEQALCYFDFKCTSTKNVTNALYYWVEFTVTSVNDPTSTFKRYLLALKDKGFLSGYYTRYTKTTTDNYNIRVIDGTDVYDNVYSHFFVSDDITPLLVESGIRATLETNFEDMPSSSASLEDLSKFIYTTVGYTIGSKTISGFSQTYSRTNGWWNTTKTYMENMYSWFENRNDNTQSLYDSFARQAPFQLGDVPLDLVNLSTTPPTLGVIYNFTPDITSPSVFTRFNFSWVTFDIVYQPINSFTSTFLKKDIDIPFRIEQFNSTGDSLSEFSRMSENMQQQANRIGNETLSIAQRIDGKPHASVEDVSSLIRPLNSYYKDPRRNDSDKYIVFRREIAIGNYYCDINYTASKDAVLKDYFTSIRTKYRAFANVDYNQSTLRKEKDVVFVKLDEKGFYSGDDIVVFGALNNTENRQNYKANLLRGLTYYLNDNNEDRINYNFEYGSAYDTISGNTDCYNTIKNDVSMISNVNSLFFYYEQFDNTSGGMYYNYNYSTTTAVDIRNALGGIVQSWQIWNERDYKTVGFSSGNLVFNSKSRTQRVSPSSLENFVLDTVGQLPIIGNYDANKNPTSGLVDIWDNKDSDTMFYVKSPSLPTIQSQNSKAKYYLQDYGEAINYTLEFNFYTDGINAEWTEWLLYYCPFRRPAKLYTAFVNPAKIRPNLDQENWDGIAVLNHETISGSKPISGEKKTLRTASWLSALKAKDENVKNFVDVKYDNNRVYIQIDWTNLDDTKWCEVVRYEPIPHGAIATTYRTLARFRKSPGAIYGQNKQNIYLTLNDTRTDKVYALTEAGLPVQTFEVDKYTSDESPDRYCHYIY